MGHQNFCQTQVFVQVLKTRSYFVSPLSQEQEEQEQEEQPPQICLRKKHTIGLKFSTDT